MKLGEPNLHQDFKDSFFEKFPSAKRSVEKNIINITKAKGIDFITPIGIIPFIFIAGFVDAVFIDIIGLYEDFLYCIFCLSSFCFLAWTGRLIIKFSHARTRLKTETTTIALATDAPLEFSGYLRTINEKLRSPIFSQNCLGYQTKIIHELVRNHNRRETTELFSLNSKMGCSFIDDGTGTAFVTSVDIQDLLMTFELKSRSFIWQGFSSNKNNDFLQVLYNLFGEKFQKNIEEKISNTNISRGRIIVTENIIYSDPIITFNGKFKKFHSLDASAIEGEVEEHIDPFEYDVLSQDHTDLYSYCNYKGLLDSTGLILDQKYINVLMPEEYNSHVNSSTRTMEERKNFLNVAIGTILIYLVTVPVIIFCFDPLFVSAFVEILYNL